MTILTSDEVFAEMEKDPAYQKAYRMQEPYYAIMSQVIKLRRQSNMTIAELAEKANVSPILLDKLLAAEYNPRLSYLIQVAEALNCTLEVTFKPIGKETKS